MKRNWLSCTVLLLGSFAVHASPFTITVNFNNGGLTTSQQAIFATAANTWMSLLPGYQTGISIAALNVYASGTTIDGPGGILGSGGPSSYTLQSGLFLPTVGEMQFDTADLAALEANGTLLPIILHEMAHVMGFGTTWVLNSFYSNGSGQFTGTNALAAYRTEFNQPSATFVPVELGGGAGTANGHWNEVDNGGGATGITSSLGDMRNELMTGWLNAPYFISNTTVASFVDIGYQSAPLGVPEPGTMTFLSIGLIFIAIHRKRSSN